MLTDAEREKLDDLRTMLGPDAGNLAMVLEQLTDAMAMINLHAVYCRVEKGPRAGQPPLDVADVLKMMENAKELVQETLAAAAKFDHRPSLDCDCAGIAANCDVTLPMPASRVAAAVAWSSDDGDAVRRRLYA